ncbi:DNA polymerase Y family protein [Ensifer sp. BR816]|uniref:DNA polymerase Y family protein n=1 Tax=Rhizobium sp. (strain BR816) TaxID=1057002 RepID=UPI00210F5545|nr:DNA polymerase Y family protein [Ensifer sp. BR816]
MFRPTDSQRILSIHFPHLPADRVARSRWGASWLSRGRPDHPPVVFAAKIDNAMRLVALDTLAERIGLKRGQGAAEARAMCPALDVIAADPAADQAFLEGLADWCDRYTPLVALDGKDGLFLDITGCAHLHGGEKGLVSDLLSRLFSLGVEARATVSSAAGLSWAAARYGDVAVIEAEEAGRVLAPLPVAGLRLPEETAAALERVGLKQVGDLLEAPRAPLARRFGSLLLLRLDQARGEADEPLSPRLPVPSFSAERRLAEPLMDEEYILELTRHLAKDVRASLERHGEGGRLFELLLFRVDGRVFRVRAHAAMPLNDAERIAALFRERLQAVHDDLDAGYGFEILRLAVLRSERLDPAQQDFSGVPEESQPLAAFIDKVAARFGPDCLMQASLAESHLPERAGGFAPVRNVAAVMAPPGSDDRVFPENRPLRIFAHPELVEATAEVPDGAPRSFNWRKIQYRVARAEGPERIAAEWWIDGEDHPTRDYFRVEDQEGRRFWLFREGLYGREVAAVRWFMHGVFA